MWDIHKTSFIGGRVSMEDSLCLLTEFNNNPDWIFGGIYDGHGGAGIAHQAARKIPNLFLDKIKSGLRKEDAFSKSYQEFSDEHVYQLVGASALSFLLENKKEITIANTGNSRMIRVDPEGRVKQLTQDHSLNNQEERERVKKAGAEIKKNHIFKQGQTLESTRSLSCHHFKDVGVISEPEITLLKKIPEKGSFFIAASDGLWKELNNKQVSILVKKAKSAKEANNRVLNFLKKKKEGKILGELDNVSIITLKN